MMMMSIGLEAIFAVALCLTFSFLLSGMEAGVFALSRLRVRRLMRAGWKRAQLLHEYLEHPENFLWTIFIGNTLATFTAFSLVAVGLYRGLGEWPGLFVASFLAVAFLVYALFDLLPKMLFRLFPNRLCLLAAVPFRLIYVALSPLTRLIKWFSDSLLRLTGGKAFQGHLFGSRSELRLMMQESGHALSSEERAMVARVLDLQNVTVGSIAVPLNKVVSVHYSAPVASVLALCRERQFTRFPVLREEVHGSRIVGLVSARDLLYRAELDLQKPVAAYLKPALYLREDVRLEEALRRLQRGGQRLSIVLTLDNRELGIVSLQDILKAIFGEVTL